MLRFFQSDPIRTVCHLHCDFFPQRHSPVILYLKNTASGKKKHTNKLRSGRIHQKNTAFFTVSHCFFISLFFFKYVLQNIHKYNIPKYIIHIHIIYICITYRNIHKYRSLQLSLYHTSSSSFSVRKTWCFQLQDKKLKYLFSMMYIAIPVRFNLTATWSWLFCMQGKDLKVSVDYHMIINYCPEVSLWRVIKYEKSY